jgi:hypothetical protein
MRPTATARYARRTTGAPFVTWFGVAHLNSVSSLVNLLDSGRLAKQRERFVPDAAHN